MAKWRARRTEKFSVRVDVTEEFPFLVTKMSPYMTVKPKQPKGDMK
jgi:PatG C-terminal